MDSGSFPPRDPFDQNSMVTPNDTLSDFPLSLWEKNSRELQQRQLCRDESDAIYPLGKLRKPAKAGAMGSSVITIKNKASNAKASRWPSVSLISF